MRRPQKTTNLSESNRAPPQKVPVVAVLPTVGRFLWTCRAGFESHLGQELQQAGLHPKILGEALVESDARAGTSPAFGRAGFRVLGLLNLDEAGDAQRAAELIIRHAAAGAIAVQPWTLDTDLANRFSADASAFGEVVRSLLPPERLQRPGLERGSQASGLAQLCVLSSRQVALGVTTAAEAISLAPGGRMRMRSGPQARSRAGSKLEEALETYGLEPSRGELCVDLGAAPGGWTERLLSRGARVIAVDPAKLAPDLLRQKKLRHVQQSAFAFAPDEPADWLFCDMAWRPLEVAQLLAKWATRQWALHLIANIKLPMQEKNATLSRIRRTLLDGGWKQLNVRQLYHDRDEVTVMGRRV